MSYDILTEAFSVASGVEFEEVPVDVETFVTDPQYMDLPPLSEIQIETIRKSTQIYRRETLDMLYSPEFAEKRWGDTKQEVIAFYGKGAGKDFMSTITVCYVVYLLLCLKDPQKYFGKPKGDNIDIMNIAINAQQASRVFFSGVKQRLKSSPWFQGKYEIKRDEINFDKSINLISGHSEAESLEGYNCRPLDVEILTKQGWKTYDQLSIGEDVFTLNHETGLGEWQPLERVNVFDSDEKLIQYSGKSFFATSTEDHRWPVVSRYGVRKFTTTGMLSAGDNIPLCAENVTLPKDKTLSDSFVEIVAWYMTEGFNDGLHCEIYQSHKVNMQNVERIRRAFENEFGPPTSPMPRRGAEGPLWRENRNRNLTEFKMNKLLAKELDKVAPGRVPTYEFLNSLTLDQMNLFVEVCMLGDNRGEHYFAQKNYEMAERFAYAVIATGRAVSYREVEVPGRDYKMLNVCIRRQKVSNPERAASVPGGSMSKSYVDNELGMVWCPTVKNSTWLSRERGTVHFTGNCIMVVLDEIAGFAMENKSGNKKAKTADAIYNMHRASVTSRFPDEGKLVLLSFSRYDGDFMTKRYNEVIAEKEVIKRSKVLKLDTDLPDGMPGNEITVEWDEDHILRYKEPGTFALRRPSWYVNPTKRIENYTRDFFKDKGEALTRFACMPTASKEDAFFPAKEKLDSAFVLDNAMDENGVFLNTFKPKPGTKYFVHVDLAQKHDRCAVSMAHVDSWTDKSIHGLNYHETLPTVVIDSVKFWQPLPGDSIDFQQVIDHILALRRRGFDIQLVTFDNWNSHDTRNNLEALGIPTGKLSIKVDQYNEFKVMVYDDRCFGPNLEELVKELKELRWINGKVDHPRSGYNDLSDSVAGAVYNAVAHTAKPVAREVEVHTGLDIARKYREEEAKKKTYAPGTIVAPTRRNMPQELQDYLNSKAG